MLLLCCSDRPETDYYYCVVHRGPAEYIQITINSILCADGRGGLKNLHNFDTFMEHVFKRIRDAPPGNVLVVCVRGQTAAQL